MPHCGPPGLSLWINLNPAIFVPSLESTTLCTMAFIRTKHQVTMVKGETFPACKLCGDHVRFTVAIAAHHAPNHEHFKK
jgi:hypothetical protein